MNCGKDIKQMRKNYDKFFMYSIMKLTTNIITTVQFSKSKNTFFLFNNQDPATDQELNDLKMKVIVDFGLLVFTVFM